MTINTFCIQTGHHLSSEGVFLFPFPHFKMWLLDLLTLIFENSLHNSDVSPISDIVFQYFFPIRSVPFHFSPCLFGHAEHVCI